MRSARWPLLLSSFLLLLAAPPRAAADEPAASTRPAGPAADGRSGVTPNDWDVTPAGEKARVGPSPFGMILAPDGERLLVSNDGYGRQSLMLVDRKTLQVVQSIPYDAPEGLFVGLAVTADGSRVFASGGQTNVVREYALAASGLSERAPIVLGPRRKQGFVTGLALSPDERVLYAANHLSGDVALVDTATRTVVRRVPLGTSTDPYDASTFPYQLLASPDGAKLWVSLWKEGKVAVLDVRSPERAGVVATIGVGEHPNALLLDEPRRRLFVANASGDSVSVIDAAADRVLFEIDVRARPGARLGTTPNALALSPDGRTLFVANAGENAIVVVDLSPEDEDASGPRERTAEAPAARYAVRGRIPVGWYPTALALAPAGDTLYVANSKDVGLGQNAYPPTYIGDQMLGSISAIPVPGAAQLERYTRQVERNRTRSGGERARRAEHRGDGEEERDGKDRSLLRRLPIEHVVYVIKENRTYDQVFGDLPGGNGDPRLLFFDDRTAPNHRRLAREFVLLDNTYCDAEISKDGHEWSMGANVTDYTAKVWPSDYSGRGTLLNRALTRITNVPGGYLWDAARKAGITYRSYGEYVINGKVRADGSWEPATTRMPALEGHFSPMYRTYDLKHMDVQRAEVWLREFREFEQTGGFPNLSIISLPSDHLAGTSPGYPTPNAMMADNDLALGRIVEAITHSRFWATTAILVIEDDTQDGFDHVDSHRTPALLISPWVKRRSVDSTHYSTVSLVRTIEELLGLEPLSLFDESAPTFERSFTSKPDLTPYVHSVPAQDLHEMNPPVKALRGELRDLARRSAKLALAEADSADMVAYNEILWRAIKGTTPPVAGGRAPAPRATP